MGRTMTDIAEWLASIGLGKYAQRFAENAIDLSVIRDLTEQDLKDLGVLLGHRRKILRAIAELDAGASAPIEAVTEPVLRGEAQRRHLTVMICDLVGSTSLSARLDPEDMRVVIDAYHAACARITRTYDGFLAEFRGDGILAYFGYPIAHEDDAERTVRAGLDIIAAVGRLETRAAEPLAVRIGIATGVVVIGDLSREGALREHAVVGETPNLAARLQALAEPGTIVVAASTRRLLNDLFHLRDLGRHEVKGIVEPVAAWAVEGVSASESRFEAVHLTGLTDLIGREDEIKFLAERQCLAWKGEGQVVLISGEPGIGKSRLAAALAERVAGEPHTRLRYQCSPYHTNSALRPFIAQLERAAGFKADDTSEQRLDKLETVLAMSASRIEGVAPLFAALLSIPFGERYPPLALSPTQQRRQTLAALLDQLEGLARQQPILLVFEDAHWADATSLELLDLTVERLRQLPVLALFTFRPEFEPPWLGLPNVGTLTLGRLDRHDVESMVARVTGGRILPAEVMKQIVVKTDGNALFVEELTKAVLEGGILVEDAEGYRLDGPLPPLAIPATLQDFLMSRLDRLAPVKEISQIGAAIGREFSYSLLRTVAGRDETALKHALAQLEEAELVFRRGDPPEAVYSFKHVLVRDAAYESLLKSRRQQLHGQVARALEERFADIVVSQPELVAHHFTEAGLIEKAIGYWLQAGKNAALRSASLEAIAHLQRGIEVTSQLPGGESKDKSELDFQLVLGPCLIATQGPAASTAVATFARARELCERLGEPPEYLQVMFWLATVSVVRGELPAALEAVEALLSAAEGRGDRPALINAIRGRAMILFFLGRIVDAHEAIERAVEVFNASQDADRTAARAAGQDAGVATLTLMSWVLWVLGHVDGAVTKMAAALERADAVNHAHTHAYAWYYASVLHVLRGEPAIAQAYAERCLAISEQHGFRQWLGLSRAIRGICAAVLDASRSGLDEVKAALDEYQRAGYQLGITAQFVLMCQALLLRNESQAALEVIDHGLAVASHNGERAFESELYRLKASACVKLGATDAQVESLLDQALRTARSQQAQSFELRAAIDLARLWAKEGKCGDARDVMLFTYGRFNEGFDTQDPIEAKAVLAQLEFHSPTDVPFSTMHNEIRK